MMKKSGKRVVLHKDSNHWNEYAMTQVSLHGGYENVNVILEIKLAIEDDSGICYFKDKNSEYTDSMRRKPRYSSRFVES